MTPWEFSANCAVCGWAVLDSIPFVYMYGAVERSYCTCGGILKLTVYK